MRALSPLLLSSHRRPVTGFSVPGLLLLLCAPAPDQDPAPGSGSPLTRASRMRSPRNAVDKDLSPWNGPVKDPNVESATGWCPVPGVDGKPSGRNGQSW